MQQKPQGIVYRLILIQIVLTLILSAVLWSLWSGMAAYSALIAGAICAIANACFTWRVFRYWGARQAKKFVIAFCFGELMKLVILGVLFVLAITWLHVAIKPFLLSFILNIFVFWLAPFIVFGIKGE